MNPSMASPLPSTSPLIAAFDIAGITGVCLGRPNDKPIIGSIDLRAAGTARPRRLFYFSDQLRVLFKKYVVNKVVYEAPLPLRAMMRIGTSEDVMLFLRGAIGVLEAEAARAGVDDISSVDVMAVRQHITGQRRFAFDKKRRKSEGKAAVRKMGEMMGLKFNTDDESDAWAIHHYACSHYNPRLALAVTPLFAER